MEQRIFDIIFEGDEVTWQSLIQDLVRVENMDPWDIDISKLTQQYIEMLKKMQQSDLRVSGKVVLAAAILLKMKSNYLMANDVLNFDRLMHPEDYTEDALYDENQPRPKLDIGDVRLIPKTPQPRKRKISIYELVDALKQALEVKKRRREILESIQIPTPERKVDISVIIAQLYEKISEYLGDEGSMTFSELVPSDRREDKIAVFLPVLHLSNQRKIDLQQDTHFGEIDITLHDDKNEREAGSAVNADLDKEFDFIEEGLKESDKNKKKR